MSWGCRRPPISRAGSRRTMAIRVSRTMQRGRAMRRANTSKTLIVVAAVLACSSAANAGWQEHASQYDANRLAKLDESKAKALDEAEKGARQSDLAIIHDVLDPKGVQTDAQALTGKWRCR